MIPSPLLLYHGENALPPATIEIVHIFGGGGSEERQRRLTAPARRTGLNTLPQ